MWQILGPILASAGMSMGQKLLSGKGRNLRSLGGAAMQGGMQGGMSGMTGGAGIPFNIGGGGGGMNTLGQMFLRRYLSGMGGF